MLKGLPFRNSHAARRQYQPDDLALFGRLSGGEFSGRIPTRRRDIAERPLPRFRNRPGHAALMFLDGSSLAERRISGSRPPSIARVALCCRFARYRDTPVMWLPDIYVDNGGGRCAGWTHGSPRNSAVFPNASLLRRAAPAAQTVAAGADLGGQSLRQSARASPTKPFCLPAQACSVETRIVAGSGRADGFCAIISGLGARISARRRQ